MAELRFPARDKATKPSRDALKRYGCKLVEIRSYAIVREDDGAELERGTLDDVFKWIARRERAPSKSNAERRR